MRDSTEMVAIPELNKKSLTPLFIQIKYFIIHAISSGRFPPDDPLPSVRQFAKRGDVAPATVQRAYRELEQEGIIVGELGRGYFVAGPPVIAPDGGPERRNRLSSILFGPILEARALGLTDADILAVIRRLLGGTATEVATPRIALVGDSIVLIERYGDYLRDRLADLRVRVDPVARGDLAGVCDDAEAAGEPVSLVVSHADSLGYAQTIAKQRQLPFESLTVDLTPEVKKALFELAVDARVGVVADSRYLAAEFASIPQYRGTYENLSAAAGDDDERLTRVLEMCNPIFHSITTKAIVRERALPGTTLIALEYQPAEAFVQGLRSIFELR